MIGRLKGLDWRFWPLLLACAALGLSLAHPTLPMKKAVQRYIFVIDITQSMNARDYHLEHLPPDRLGFVKAAIGRVLHDLPCGSEIGLGLFTTRNTQLLFEPLEICEHFAIVDDVLAHIDWRMAWSADSYIAQGLFTGLREIAQRDATIRLAFFTDGQRFPPGAERPYFQGKPGEVRGLIVGVGGITPVPIPRLDRENRPQGFWEYADLQDFLPPPESTGTRVQASNYYLARLDEQALRELASLTGLRYHRLVSPADLSAALRSPDLAEERWVTADARWILALLALALLLSTYLAGFRKIVNPRRPSE
ncbi:MAG TPA: vWA domain-containing protein [Methylococcaceae bacterium]|nr:vWA domain-containing protein [Methylococcaceae bacterium]